MQYANDLRTPAERGSHLLTWLRKVLGGERPVRQGRNLRATDQMAAADDSPTSMPVVRDWNSLDAPTRRDLGLPERSPEPSWTREFDTWSW